MKDKNEYLSERVKPLKASAIREMFKRMADPEIISLAGGSPPNFSREKNLPKLLKIYWIKTRLSHCSTAQQTAMRRLRLMPFPAQKRLMQFLKTIRL